jgi:hypothetical protein
MLVKLTTVVRKDKIIYGKFQTIYTKKYYTGGPCYMRSSLRFCLCTIEN